MSTLTQINQLLNEKAELTNVVLSLTQGNARLFIETRINEIDQLLLKFSNINSNYLYLMDFLFTDEVAETKTTTLTLYKPLYMLHLRLVKPML